MSKKHLKRLNAPKTWDIKRKGIKYIKRPNPGAHSFKFGMPLSIFLRDVLKLAKTNKEVKNILSNKEILVDGAKRGNVKFIVGFMDTISVPSTKEYYRVILNKKGELDIIKIDGKESKQKICKINGKRMSKKGLQINLSDGRNILVDKKECGVGDSLLIEVPEQNVKEVIKLDKESLVVLVGGKHIGKITNVREIRGDVMRCGEKDLEFDTLKKYAFVVGKEKPLIKVEE